MNSNSKNNVDMHVITTLKLQQLFFNEYLFNILIVLLNIQFTVSWLVPGTYHSCLSVTSNIDELFDFIVLV